MDLTALTVTRLRGALANGEVRSVDLADQLIARTDACAQLNCYVDFDAQDLRRQAREADARLAAGERLPLLGVPIALKDNIEAIGLQCGNGTRALHGRRPQQDAALVGRLRAAGALIAGKLGMHELAFGITSNNAVTGAIRNPWDPARIPGGSSGGSGAAVSAHLVPASIGTDTGGSVRVPAALCGVAGLRPTVGRVSAEGIAPISATRDTAGPIARCVADLALIDGVLTGDDAPPPSATLGNLRLGVPSDYYWSDLDPGVASAAQGALSILRDAGATLVPVELPGLAELDGEVSFVVALYEFVRDMTAYLKDRSRGISFETLVSGIGSADVKAIAGALAGDGAVPRAAYEQALQARVRLQALYAGTFASARVSALLFPTTPLTAAPIGQDETVMHNGRACPTFGTFIRNTDPGSNASLPGVTLPIGLCDGLPVGLALDGPIGNDRQLLGIAAAIEAVLAPMPAAPYPR
ncbi:MAG: indoleacetamide hydrolase [Lautropia sp.]